MECVWLRHLLANLGIGQSLSTTIYTHSQNALAIAQNLVFYVHTKHIEVHYHYVRGRIHAGEIALPYVPTHDNVADGFIKPFSGEKFEDFWQALSLLPLLG